MRTEAGHRERFLPYRYARSGIEALITRCMLDDIEEVAPDPDSHVIDLDVPWTVAAFDVLVQIPEATVGSVLPPGFAVESLELLAIVRCPSTFLRFAVRSPVSGDETSVKVALRREEVAGSVLLQVFLVRSTATARRAGYATARGARLADSRAWELRVDRLRETRGQYIEIRYHPFSTEPTVPLRDRKNLYLLRMDQAAPELWLNSDHERIAATLDSKGTVGRIARMREVAFDQIAQGVWTQLFLRAARNYVQSEETIYPWQDAVLDLLLRDIFPEVRGASERRDRLAEAWNDFPIVLARLDAALQRRSDITGHLSRLMEQAEDDR